MRRLRLIRPTLVVPVGLIRHVNRHIRHRLSDAALAPYPTYIGGPVGLIRRVSVASGFNCRRRR
ncbi:hypothetical protein ACQP3C_19810 [Escherichia coli]